ncbi:MAG: TIR domain-containing protein [Solirubrobacteraceae bacterium]
MDTAPARPDVFISYSRRDRAFVEGTLLPALVQHEKHIWIDLADIPPASDWRERVLAGVAAANALIFVLSPDSLASPVCAEELARAVELNKRMIPVLRRDIAGAPLPPELARSNWVYLREEDDRDRGIALVVEALETDLEWRDAHSRLAVRTAEWLDGSRDRSYLLRGSDLSSAEAWLAHQGEHAERATSEQAAYIVASRQATTRRQRITLTGVLGALAIATVLAVYALIQRSAAEERARVATSRELAASALATLPRDPELATLLADAGARKVATTEAEDALRRTLGDSHVTLTLRGHRGPVDSALFADRERLIITSGHDGTVRVWDARTGRSLSVMRGHEGRIRGLAVTPDASRIVSTGEDGTARVWQRASGRATVLRGHADEVHGPAFSPDGRLVLTASSDGTARLWDARTGRPRAVLEGHRAIVFSARFDASGERVLTAGADGTARLWSAADGRPLAVLRGHDGWVNGAAFSPDDRLVATAGEDATARIWSVATGRQLRVLHLAERVASVRFAPDSRRLATASDDGTAAVWSVRTGTRIAHLRGHQDAVHRAVFDAGGDIVATSSEDNTARVWDARSSEPVAVLRGHTDGLGSPAFSRDGTHVLTASDDGTARVWALPQRAAPISGGGGPLKGGALSPDGSLVLTVRDSGVVRVLDARSRKLVRRFGRPQFYAPDAAFLPDGRLAIGVAVWDDRAAVIVDARSGRVLVTMRAPKARTRAISVSRDGSRAVTVGLPPDNAVHVWDTRSGRLVSRFEGAGHTRSATLSPDGSRVIRGALFPDAIEAWDATRGRLVASLGDSPGVFSAASFSPDGERAIVTTAQGAVPVWDMRSLRPARVLQPRAQAFLDQVVSVDWSPNGDLAAVADRNDTGVVRLFGVAGGDLRTELRHGGEVRHVAFSGDGRWLVTAGLEPTARVWDVASGRQVAELRGHSRELVAVTFGPEAHQVLTASKDGTARVHECEACASLPQLRKRVADHVSRGRTLTPAERRTYLHESG